MTENEMYLENLVHELNGTIDNLRSTINDLEERIGGLIEDHESETQNLIDEIDYLRERADNNHIGS